MAVAHIITEKQVEKNTRRGAWIYALPIPAFIPLIVSIWRARAHGLVPTGFIQYDMAYYMANARQHFVDGFHLTYSNPYAPYGSPAIYFQPHIFLLALLERIGLGPGIALNIFGVAAVTFASWAAIRLYREVVGLDTRAKQIGIVIFFWGGGVLSLAGLIVGLPGGLSFARAAFLFDPNEGWWMLNFGRNLAYPTEAFYHGIFLSALLMAIRRRIGAALALSAILSMCHPYTGLSLALVLAAFGLVDRNWRMFGGATAIAAMHVAYYMVFLNRFADHRALRAQWELDWPYVAWTFGPALYLVGFLALMRWRDVLRDRTARLFAVCFVVVFALTQHDLVLKPMQPIHFARGNDWAALFFLASPAIVGLIEKAMKRPVLLAVLMAVFCFDNVAWFWSFRDVSVQKYAIVLTPGERDALEWLGSHGERGAIVVSEDRWINYLTPTYSDLRPWFGHDFNTPHADQRRTEAVAAFAENIPLPAPLVYYIPRADSKWTPLNGAERIYYNPEFSVWRRHPVN